MLIRLLEGIPIAIVINIALGAYLGKREQEFSWKILWAGVVKGAVIYGSMAGLMLLAHILPELRVLLNGTEYTIPDALVMILWGEVVYYVAQIFKKGITILQSKNKDIIVEPAYDEGFYLEDEVGLG